MDKKNLYPLTTDCVIFGYAEGQLKVALIERKNPPFQGMWAFPGGFVETNETVEESAQRELQEETGIQNVYLEQFHAFNKPGRDPRGPTVTVAFFALVNSEKCSLVAADDAANAKWWPAYELPKLAFDHDEIYREALKALRIAIRVNPLAFELLPKQFTLSEMQNLYEQILGTKLDKRNFQEKVAKMQLIKPVGKLYEYDAALFKDSFF